MKKIAIISELNLDNVNYGNRLQAYALNKYVNDNYENFVTETLLANKITKKKRTKITFDLIIKLKNRLFRKKDKINYIYDFSQRLKLFNEFTDKNIILNKKINKKNLFKADYDIFIVGSDVVWAQANGVINKTKFLDFKTAKKFKRIAYAASFGKNYIPKENVKYIHMMLTKSSINLLNNIGINNVSHTCDPTLLLPQKFWNNICKDISIKDKYIFVYLLGKDKKQREEIENIANDLNLKIVTIPHANGCYNEVDNNFGDYIFDASPQEWLNLIKNSEYVITDSFHGIIFSTIFEKRFIALKREYTEDINVRLIDYLDTIESNDKYISIPNTDYLKKLEWDYKKINKKLNNFINNSKRIIKEILK